MSVIRNNKEDQINYDAKILNGRDYQGGFKKHKIV